MTASQAAAMLTLLERIAAAVERYVAWRMGGYGRGVSMAAGGVG